MSGRSDAALPAESANAARGLLPHMNSAFDYWVDAWQRSILLLDVLRQRGNNYLEHNARKAPHVLSFDAELVLDGRTLPRPVNYGLVRIVPPKGTAIDPSKRPFIVFDPRAGHGPGIGGMKHDSEIGVALAAGHPCYFVGFLPDPMPGQTIEDVCEAEARFVEEVAARHPNAEGKPCLIGNCQAGWQIMMMSAIHPDQVGPIMLAGSPLSYWAGVHGKNPMRYLGGLLGGTWLTSLAGDLGNGIFDGANLVANFESLHPDNTYWKKIYNVYSKVDTEAAALSRIREMVGQPGAAQCRGDAVDRRPAVCRQQARLGRTAHRQRGARRSAQHQIADHRVLLRGATTSRRRSRRWTGSSTSTTTRTRSSRPARRSSIACIRASAISASLSPARSRRRSTASSPRRWT